MIVLDASAVVELLLQRTRESRLLVDLLTEQDGFVWAPGCRAKVRVL